MTDCKEYKEFAGKKLLVLAGADVHIKVVKAAQEMGIYVIVTDYLPPESSPSKLVADEYWDINIMEVDRIVEKCRENKVDGVLSFCIDPAQIPYQRICEKLGVPCFGTRHQFEVLTNKRAFKDYCKEHGVDVIPEYSYEEVMSGKAVFPVLVKPSDSRGSRGQTVCHSIGEVPGAVEFAKSESSDGAFLIERYMGGMQDMTFAYIVIDGNPYILKLGDRYLGEVKDGLDRQHIATVLPSRNAELYREKVEPKVEGMIRSLGIKFGAVFLQGFWEDGHVYMYDPGMRFPGGDFDIVLRKATGFDNMKAFVRFAMTGDAASCFGDPVGAYKLNGHICFILSIAVRPGRIAVYEGLDVMAADPRVFSVSKRASIGDVIPASGDLKQRVAEFVAYLPDTDAIQDFLTFVYSNVVVLDDEGNDMIVSKPMQLIKKDI